MAVRQETTWLTPSWIQMCKDLMAPTTATTRWSEFWVATWQFLYFSFVKMLAARLCMTCDEFWIIQVLYIELWWIVQTNHAQEVKLSSHLDVLRLGLHLSIQSQKPDQSGISKTMNIDKIARKPMQNSISEIWESKIENWSESWLIAG
jgi:hypothetical protein